MSGLFWVTPYDHKKAMREVVEVNRPDFKSYKYAADPRKAYSEAMKHYLVYLEENQQGQTYQTVCIARDRARNEVCKLTMKNSELEKTLKILRSQIKHMWKENHAN